MGNKTKRKNRMYQKPKTMPIRQVQRMNGTPVKDSRIPVKAQKKPKSLVQSNPKLSVIVLIATYFILDYLMMDATQTLHMALIATFTMLASSTLYSFYVNDYQRGTNPTDGTDVPKFVKDKKKYTLIGWFVITAWGILLLILEPVIVPRLFTVLDSKYYQAQIMLMIFIAPVMEEIGFRYLLYDRWLKKKCGWFLGFVIASFIFVICHPVTNTQSLIIYWAPTVLFFLIYNEFGLYGSIMIHMIYNMLAL